MSEQLQLVPLVIPVESLVDIMTPNGCSTKSAHASRSPFARGDLLDEYLRREHYGRGDYARYEMLKDALAHQKLLLIVVGMESVPDDGLMQELDEYILTALGRFSHLVILTKGNSPSDAHLPHTRFEECLILRAKARTLRQHVHRMASTDS